MWLRDMTRFVQLRPEQSLWQNLAQITLLMAGVVVIFVGAAVLCRFGGYLISKLVRSWFGIIVDALVCAVALVVLLFFGARKPIIKR